jgi:hypothetical protein
MKRSHSLTATLIALAFCTCAQSQSPSSQPTNPTSKATPARKANSGKPSSVSSNTYQGATGKKKDPGTACSTARLNKDGTLDCGMSGKAAEPVRSK